MYLQSHSFPFYVPNNKYNPLIYSNYCLLIIFLFFIFVILLLHPSGFTLPLNNTKQYVLKRGRRKISKSRERCALEVCLLWVTVALQHGGSVNSGPPNEDRKDLVSLVTTSSSIFPLHFAASCFRPSPLFLNVGHFKLFLKCTFSNCLD